MHRKSKNCFRNVIIIFKKKSKQKANERNKTLKKNYSSLNL